MCQSLVRVELDEDVLRVTLVLHSLFEEEIRLRVHVRANEHVDDEVLGSAPGASHKSDQQRHAIGLARDEQEHRHQRGRSWLRHKCRQPPQQPTVASVRVHDTRGFREPIEAKPFSVGNRDGVEHS